MNINRPKLTKLSFSLIALGIVNAVLLTQQFYSTIYAAPLPFNIGGEALNQQLPHVVNNKSINPNWYSQNFASLIGDLLSIVIPVAALILLLYLIWGGIEWLTSGGDKGKLEKARGRITTAVIGIIVVSASISIFMLMQQILNICVLDLWGSGTCSTPTSAPARQATDPSWAFTGCAPSGDVRCNNQDIWTCEAETGEWEYYRTCPTGKSCYINLSNPEDSCR